MEAVGRYLVCVAGAALISGIVLGIVKDSAHKELLKMICGIALLLCVIRPVANIPVSGISRFALPYREEASAAASEGEEYARAQLCEIIKAETEAYILDKAYELDAVICVEVILSTDEIPLPVAIRISGEVSPYAKQKLQQIIAQELNIAKENQIWTG